ncbi:hypothetical protein ACJJTC_012897 [Scirpophaga incertulas]
MARETHGAEVLRTRHVRRQRDALVNARRGFAERASGQGGGARAVRPPRGPCCPLRASSSTALALGPKIKIGSGRLSVKLSWFEGIFELNENRGSKHTKFRISRKCSRPSAYRVRSDSGIIELASNNSAHIKIPTYGAVRGKRTAAYAPYGNRRARAARDSAQTIGQRVKSLETRHMFQLNIV